MIFTCVLCFPQHLHFLANLLFLPPPTPPPPSSPSPLPPLIPTLPPPPNKLGWGPFAKGCPVLTELPSRLRVSTLARTTPNNQQPPKKGAGALRWKSLGTRLSGNMYSHSTWHSEIEEPIKSREKHFSLVLYILKTYIHNNGQTVVPQLHLS